MSLLQVTTTKVFFRLTGSPQNRLWIALALGSLRPLLCFFLKAFLVGQGSLEVSGLSSGCYNSCSDFDQAAQTPGVHCSGAEGVFILWPLCVEVKQAVCLSLVVKLLLVSCDEEFGGQFVAFSL